VGSIKDYERDYVYTNEATGGFNDLCRSGDSCPSAEGL
jgi:hypothetical protein